MKQKKTIIALIIGMMSDTTLENSTTMIENPT